MGLSLTPDERIEALERRLADAEFSLDVERLRREKLENQVQELQARRITVADLPVAALIRTLEKLGQLDASQALEPGSITSDLLCDELKPKAVVV
jgi:hypothetical protein